MLFDTKYCERNVMSSVKSTFNNRHLLSMIFTHNAVISFKKYDEDKDKNIY